MTVTEDVGAPERVPPIVPYPMPIRIWHELRDPLGYLQSLEAELGDIVVLRKGRTFALFHPEFVRHVLQENHRNYQKGPRSGHRSHWAKLR